MSKGWLVFDGIPVAGLIFLSQMEGFAPEEQNEIAEAILATAPSGLTEIRAALSWLLSEMKAFSYVSEQLRPLLEAVHQIIVEKRLPASL